MWRNSIFMKWKTSQAMRGDRIQSVVVWPLDQVDHRLPEAQASFGVVEMFCLDLGSGLIPVAFVKPHRTERLKSGHFYSCWTSVLVFQPPSLVLLPLTRVCDSRAQPFKIHSRYLYRTATKAPSRWLPIDHRIKSHPSDVTCSLQQWGGGGVTSHHHVGAGSRVPATPSTGTREWKSYPPRAEQCIRVKCLLNKYFFML